ncbi:GH15 family glucan-1,4-alpha-glucosidase [Paenibacillus endophyticus]|uniref:GH15 family glucan-1,4-alpha-glucosidase n=1 Tax=Paenibacillus endophyticus TaxID=1294268 RepID=A0A7W5GCG0_9BACL|nr:amylo-alpha-1,6-glucosidase [Paenibacillus endophyticus]MBB3155364.1 GH15 family glucan-1,4-alpha-glucosidase [Paenibacillus endophyticus]
MNLIEEAYRQSIRVVERCMHAIGAKASALSEGYNQVFTRDSMITFLGASLVDSQACQASFRMTLETLARYQTKLGMIPLSVEVDNPAIEANQGAVDSNPWYVIGHSVYYARYKDTDFLEKHLESIRKAMLWLEYQDSNNCGLIEVQEAADWGDLFANRGNILYDNVLYYKALVEYAHIQELCGESGVESQARAEDVKQKMNVLLWPGDVEEQTRMVRENGYSQEWLRIIRMSNEVFWFGKFYLPYASFRDFGYHCDALGNSLAILFDIADEAKANTIIEHFIQTGMNKPYPIMANYPPINPGDKDWREYYRNAYLNLPYQYHNGGIWPFVGGFYVAALMKAGKKEFAREELENLARANQVGKRSEWEFNEWLNGRSGMPSGMAYQAWSAGMYIFAYKCVMEDATI